MHDDPVNLSDINLTYFREKLLALREELLQVEKTGNEAAQTVELDQSRVGRLSRMDALQGQAMAKKSQQRRSIQIQRIDTALQRMDKANFGLCVRCEETINPKRLEFDPTALLCIDCANKGEK